MDDDDTKLGLLFTIAVEDHLYNWPSSMQLYYCDVQDQIKNNSPPRFSLDTLTKMDHHPPIDIHHLSSSSLILRPVVLATMNPPMSKVVRFFYHNGQVYVQVYTLGDERGWRNKQVTTRYCLSSISPGIFVNGAIHWKRLHKETSCGFQFGIRGFQTLPSSPPCVTFNWGIQVLGGYLCAVDIEPDTNYMDIWVFKNNSAGQEKLEDHPWSWSKEFHLDMNDWGGDMGSYCWPLALTKNNEIVLWYQGKILHV